MNPRGRDGRFVSPLPVSSRVEWHLKKLIRLAGEAEGKADPSDIAELDAAINALDNAIEFLRDGEIDRGAEAQRIRFSEL